MTQKRKHIRVTYSSLSSPDPLLHEYYEEDVAIVRQNAGKTYPMYINGQWVESNDTFTKISPVDTNLIMGHFPNGTADHVTQAVSAARAAADAWRNTPWQERIEMLEKVADLISERLFLMGAVVSLEVGKNRLEAIGEVEETADLIRYCTEAMKANKGFVKPMSSESERVSNRSVLKPYGVWGVISPFNYPCALSGGPAGAALVAGNTVVHKAAAEGSLTAYMLAECFHDAGIPPGVYNLVTGGDEPGKALVDADIDGITFTGSYEVGMSIIRNFTTSKGYVRPVIAEMGGKNPTIVTSKADVDKAAIGVMRSAFGATGQKCSACSRVFVHKDVAAEFSEKIVKLTSQIKVGDPTNRATYMGPIINETAYQAYRSYVEDLRQNGDILIGGSILEDKGDGYYVAPTIVANVPDDHPLWKHEMFAPILMIREFTDNAEAMQLANDIDLGLTAGFFSEDQADVEWFLDNIEAGCVYVNRDGGATTGAWPGYQAFGGWKGSTGTHKAAGSHYYLAQYMREQSHTLVD